MHSPKKLPLDTGFRDQLWGLGYSENCAAGFVSQIKSNMKVLKRWHKVLDELHDLVPQVENASSSIESCARSKCLASWSETLNSDLERVKGEKWKMQRTAERLRYERVSKTSQPYVDEKCDMPFCENLRGPTWTCTHSFCPSCWSLKSECRPIICPVCRAVIASDTDLKYDVDNLLNDLDDTEFNVNDMFQRKGELESEIRGIKKALRM